MSKYRGSVVRRRLNLSMTSSQSRSLTHTAASSSRRRLQPPTSRFHTAESSLDTCLVTPSADGRPNASSFSSSRWQTDLLQSLPCLSFGSLFTKADRKQTQPSLVQPIAHLCAVSSTFPSRRSLLSKKPTGSSQSAGRGLVRRGEGRRRTSRYTTSARAYNSLLHLPTHM